MEENVSEAINNYYKLKHKYEEQITNQKRRIINNNELTKKDKKLKFKQLKINCINCGKKGGTIFTNNNNMLSAVCGNTKDPCNLNININRGNYTNIYDTEVLIQKDIESIRKKIMMLKLDLLFNYSDESVIIKEFNVNKKDISDLTKSLLSIRKEYLSIVDNQDDKVFVNDGNIKLRELKEQLKTLIKNYTSNNNINYINDMVETYIRDIRPLTQEIQNKAYKHMEIYESEHKQHLLQNYYNYSDLYVPINNKNEAKIITNKL